MRASLCSVEIRCYVSIYRKNLADSNRCRAVLPECPLRSKEVRPTKKMSHSQQLVHSIRNQLSVVIGRAELLAVATPDGQTQEHSKAIKAAALKVHDLLRQFAK